LEFVEHGAGYLAEEESNDGDSAKIHRGNGDLGKERLMVGGDVTRQSHAEGMTRKDRIKHTPVTRRVFCRE
jgi:hypothetical protein